MWWPFKFPKGLRKPKMPTVAKVTRDPFRDLNTALAWVCRVRGLKGVFTSETISCRNGEKRVNLLDPQGNVVIELCEARNGHIYMLERHRLDWPGAKETSK